MLIFLLLPFCTYQKTSKVKNLVLQHCAGLPKSQTITNMWQSAYLNQDISCSQGNASMSRGIKPAEISLFIILPLHIIKEQNTSC